MQSIIYAIAPLLILIALGFLLGKKDILSKEQFKGLTQLTFVVFIPSLLFLSLYQSKSLSGISFKWLLSFYIPLIIVYAISFLFFKLAKQKEPELFSLACSFSNNVLIGVPILLNLLGDGVLLPAFLVISIHALILFSLTSFLAAKSNTDKSVVWYLNIAKTIWVSSRSPIVLSLITGLIFKSLEIPLHSIAIETLSILKHAALPCALIVLGASLAQYQVAGSYWRSAIICCFKLILLPLLIYLFSKQVFSLSDFYTQIFVVMSASPVGINVYMFTAQNKSAAPFFASTILISTSLSIVTLPLWLLFLGVT